MTTTALDQALMDRIRRIPVYDALGMDVLRFGEGECDARVPRNPQTDGIFESYHGGMLMAAADTIACFALLTQAGADAYMATTDMNIRFLAPCLTDVTCKAKVIKFGRTICPVAVDLVDENGQLVAVAQVTYIRLPGPPKR